MTSPSQSPIELGADGDDVSNQELEREAAACRDLLGVQADDGDRATPEAEAVLDALREAVRVDQQRERGLRASLRAWPTGRRALLLVALASVLTLASFTLGRRGDWSGYPMGRMAFTLALYGALTTIVVWLLLRPLHRLPAPAQLVAKVVTAALVVPLAWYFNPLHAPGHTAFAAGEGGAFVLGCGKCLAYGGVLGVPVLLLALWLRRSSFRLGTTGLLAGLAGGLTGILTLQVHCPIVDPTHLQLGHAALVPLLGAGAWLWTRRNDSPNPRPHEP
jgi:hypothetical protein